MKQGGKLGGCCRLLLSLALWLSHPAETLEVKMKSHKTEFLHADVVLPCRISGYLTPELNLNETEVMWYLVPYGGNQKMKVYSVVAGEHSSFRNGSRLDGNMLRKGNAELFLPQIQFSERGTYTCSVAVTGVRAEDITTLEIVVQPTVSLFPKEVTVERGKEKILSCKVNKFYPEVIDIKWEKNSKHTSDKMISPEDIHRVAPVENRDGTFNATSNLRLQPTLQDDGSVYICIVKHSSFPRHSSLNVTLKVTGPPKILITGNTVLNHLKETQLQCSFSDFRPKPLIITFFLSTGDTKKKIFSWNTNSVGDSELGNENIPLIEPQNSMFRFEPNLEKKKKRTFDVSCKIFIVPDAVKLHSFELSVQVTHQSSQHSSPTEKSFKVIALPVLDQIQCSTDVPRTDESVILSCRISLFFPRTIQVRWYKEEELFSGNITVSKPTEDLSGLFFCTSSITYRPEVADIGKRFTCRTKLEGSQEYIISSWEMKTPVTVPKVSQIHCDPVVPLCGKSITLSCLLTDFYPANCDICWRKNFKELTYATVVTEDPQLDSESNLYYRKTQVSFIPTPEDHAVDFFVEINHCNKAVRQKYPLMLKGFPKIAGIFLEPSDAEYGSMMSLMCTVTDFYPEDISVKWYNGEECVTDHVLTEGPSKDSNGCFRLSSVFKLTPTALDYDKPKFFRVFHETLRNSIEKIVYLKLPAKSPVVSDIRPSQEEGSTSIRFEISLSDFAPPDIKVEWFKGWKRISDDNNPKDIQIGENQLCCFTSSIELKIEKELKAEDFKTIRCEVSHPATQTLQEKCFLLKVKGFVLTSDAMQ
ncbi:natural cytotoxicity triggering receptor 3 ligand 1 isoform X2 [Varanus komodoensis]|uniref:natural cytotoxicity triggering receptor 3 ligand 1 isoform X2 n=1 Tax=Varanus komodoensis TaxID=61221 RepID=UPI001CF7D21B|nr:natural cytotoxicity triggering receptor 3 ligand 1 isoform X2 [Varanus komodoensis]